MSKAASGANGGNGSNGNHGAAPVIDKLSKRAHEAIDTASDKAGAAADWLDDHQKTLRQSPEKVMDGCSTYVSENPFKAVGIAFGAGLLFSLFFGSSGRK